jgi:hypothetical protein
MRWLPGTETGIVTERPNVSENPYEPPRAFGGGADSKPPSSRESLRELIQELLAGKFDWCQFEEQLLVYVRSKDAVVRFVADRLSSLYDEEIDHINLRSKLIWDYLQRLLLLLSAKCEIKIETKTIWCHSQLLATIALVAFVCSAIYVGWGFHLLFLSVPFGLIAFAISKIRDRNAGPVNPYGTIICPFPSIEAFDTAYRSSHFSKLRYPRHYRRKATSSLLSEYCSEGFQSLIRCFLSPVALVELMIPYFHVQIRIAEDGVDPVPSESRH